MSSDGKTSQALAIERWEREQREIKWTLADELFKKPESPPAKSNLFESLFGSDARRKSV